MRRGVREVARAVIVTHGIVVRLAATEHRERRVAKRFEARILADAWPAPLGFNSGQPGSAWVTAWLNLLALVAVLAAIDVGAWSSSFIHAFGPSIHMHDTLTWQDAFMLGLGAA